MDAEKPSDHKMTKISHNLCQDWLIWYVLENITWIITVETKDNT